MTIWVWRLGWLIVTSSWRSNCYKNMCPLYGPYSFSGSPLPSTSTHPPTSSCHHIFTRSVDLTDCHNPSQDKGLSIAFLTKDSLPFFWFVLTYIMHSGNFSTGVFVDDQELMEYNVKNVSMQTKTIITCWILSETGRMCHLA